jgi:hypothetical protein
MLFRFSVILLLVTVGAGVTCAAICGEDCSKDGEHTDGSHCKECMSTAFTAGDKISSDPLSYPDISMSFVTTLRATQPDIPGRTTGVAAPLSNPTSLIRLRAFRI